LQFQPKVQLLIESGADIHADNDYALVKAASRGRSKVVRLLVQSDANIHAKNN